MKILGLQRLDARTIGCCYERDGQPHKVTVQVLVDGEIRGLQLTDISPEERWRLYNSPEGLDFIRHLWIFLDGEPLTLPIELKIAAKHEGVEKRAS